MLAVRNYAYILVICTLLITVTCVYFTSIHYGPFIHNFISTATNISYMHQYGIQVFDLSVEQICSLLENAGPDKGITALNRSSRLIPHWQNFLLWLLCSQNTVCCSRNRPCQAGRYSDSSVPSDGRREVLSICVQRGKQPIDCWWIHVGCAWGHRYCGLFCFPKFLSAVWFLCKHFYFQNDKNV